MPEALPEDVVRELRDHSRIDRLDLILQQAVAGRLRAASRELDSKTKFAAWAKEHLESPGLPARERGLAHAQYMAACHEVRAARTSLLRAQYAADGDEAA